MPNAQLPVHSGKATAAVRINDAGSSRTPDNARRWLSMAARRTPHPRPPCPVYRCSMAESETGDGWRLVRFAGSMRYHDGAMGAGHERPCR